MQFWQFNRNFFQKVQEIFYSVSGNEKEESELEKIKPSKFSNGHVKGDFDNPTIKKIQQKQKLSQSICEIEMKKILSHKQYFSWKSSQRAIGMQFWQPCWKFFDNYRKIIPQPLPFLKNFFFLGKKSFFFFEIFLWTRSYKIWQPRRYFYGRVRATLQQHPKVIKYFFFVKRSPRNVPVDRRNAVFTTPSILFREEA